MAYLWHMSSLPYKVFCARSPKYDAKTWDRLKALYTGTRKAIQENKGAIEDIFPHHIGEEEMVYQERLKRSTYIPYAGQIVDFFVSALASDPVKVTMDPAPSDDYYHDLIEDVTPPGGNRIPLNSFLADQLRAALVLQRSWTLVDLPRMPDPENGQDALPKNLKEQMDSGALNAYLVAVPAYNVVDWQCNAHEQLEWALVKNVVSRRADLTSSRDIIREEYTYYTPEAWELYVLEYDPTKNPPNDDTPVKLEASGKHSFGVVPLVELEMPDGLHLMAKIDNMCTTHFNKQSASDWAQYRSLFSFLVATLGDNTTSMQPAGEDPNRAINQKIGVGRVMVLGENDDIKYVTPEHGPFEAAMQANNLLRDEMFRVANAMALSVDNSGAALKRSGDSKAIDQAAMGVVLKKLGDIMREHICEVFGVIMRGRGEMSQDSSSTIDINVTGLENFDDLSLNDFLAEVAVIKDLDIPSQTFKHEYYKAIVRRYLGGTIDDDTLLKIDDELEKNITAEVQQAQESQDLDNEIKAIQAQTAPPVPKPTK